MSNSLIKNTSLKHLDLADNKISDNGATSLSNLLIKNTSLTHLNLEDNKISDNGATSISNSLIKNTSLKELYLNSIHEMIENVATLELIYREIEMNGIDTELVKKRNKLLYWLPIKLLLHQ